MVFMETVSIVVHMCIGIANMASSCLCYLYSLTVRATCVFSLFTSKNVCLSSYITEDLQVPD